MTQDGNEKANTWAMLCHLTALFMYIGIPFGHIIIPLIIWLSKRDEFSFVDEQGKESLNFQISMTIYVIIAVFLILILIGIVLLPILIVTQIVLVVIATIRTSRGEGYRYPFTIRFIK